MTHNSKEQQCVGNKRKHYNGNYRWDGNNYATWNEKSYLNELTGDKKFMEQKTNHSGKLLIKFR